jgi:protein disulfide-isomerase
MTKQPTKRKSLLAMLLLSVFGATLGCAKDSTRNVVSDFFEPPSSRAIDEIELQPPRATNTLGNSPKIQQASFEAQIPEPQWLTSLPQAISQAQSENKLILMDFTGSDWCHFCVKLKDEIFDTPEFKAWAGSNVVLLELDYPKRSQLPPQIQQQNQMLKSRYSISSYPTVILADVEGNVKAKMGYQNGQSPAQWVQMAEARLQEANTGSARIANRR